MKSVGIASSIFTTENTPSVPSQRLLTDQAQTGGITGARVAYSKRKDKRSDNLKHYRATHYRCGICRHNHFESGYWVYRRYRNKLEKVFSCVNDLPKYRMNFCAVGGS